MNAIYIIKNRINGKIYLGSSTNVEKRLSTHKQLLKRNKHHSYKLQRAWNRYGEENFEFEIYEEIFFPKDYLKYWKFQYLDSLETFYIQSMECHVKGYNISPFADRPLITKEGIMKGITTRRKNGSFQKTQEQKINLSNGIKNSDKFKRALNNRNKTHSKVIYIYNKEGDFIKEIKGAKECSEFTGASENQIRKCLYGESLSTHNYRFRAVKEEKLVSWEEEAKNRKRKSKKIIMKDLQNNIIREFIGGYKEFTDKMGKDSSFLSRYINNKSIYLGFILEYGE